MHVLQVEALRPQMDCRWAGVTVQQPLPESHSQARAAKDITVDGFRPLRQEDNLACSKIRHLTKYQSGGRMEGWKLSGCKAGLHGHSSNPAAQGSSIHRSPPGMLVGNPAMLSKTTSSSVLVRITQDFRMT